ncbi:MAG: homocysteine S-methyltransferase family protein, partial [bacterium]
MANGLNKNIYNFPLLLDGGMGISIRNLGLNSSDYGDHPGCHEILNRTVPDRIAEIHTAFFNAGCNLVETNTFGGTPFKLDEYNLGPDARELNRLSAQIARDVADRFNGLVVGSMGPSGLLPTSPDYCGSEPDAISAGFAVQAEGLIEGGVDILLVETSQDFLEFKSALIGCRDAMDSTGRHVQLWGSVSLHMNGRMLMGTAIDAALALAVGLRLDAFGINCATGPVEMFDAVRYLAEHSPIPVVVFPNAGMPVDVGGEAVFPLGPDEFAEKIKPFLKMGVEVIGGCCGSTHEHMAALRTVFDNYSEREKPSRIFKLASSISSQDLIQEGSPLVIGERLNSHGSRKFKKLLMNEDWNGIIDIARDQLELGAQVFDLALAIADRDNEPGDYVTLIERLSIDTPLPMMVDSVDPESVHAALLNMPGVPIINSINLEKPERAEKVLKLLKRYSGAVVAMLIDESGMAKTVGRKVEVASKLFDLIVNKHGLDPDSILFDPLTFTLATGQDDLKNAASETLESIIVLREKFPKSGVLLGVSNVSYGFQPAIRKIINAVFLHHAIKNGLTAAIINPMELRDTSEFDPKGIELATDLIFNRRDDAIERLIEFATELGDNQQTVIADPAIPLTPPEVLRGCILDRKETGLTEALNSCLETTPAPAIVSGILLPAMKEVGDRMNRRETILPHVLRSAEVMKKALDYLEPYLGSDRSVKKRKIVLATVFGDVHDIGKNLVKSILVNNGFDVIDLGKQVPARAIIEAVKKHKPMAVGLSALLVSTSAEMGVCVEALHEAGLSVPVMIGGAAVSPALARKISTVNGKEYSAGVHYASDAFAALDIARKIAGEETDKPEIGTATASPDKSRQSDDSEKI